MVLGRVLGTVVSTIKHPDYLGMKLYVIQPLDAHLRPAGETFLAVDTVQSGEGDVVLVLREGNGVRQILQRSICPIRSLVVGVVDEVDAAGVGA
ncbi:MAG: EutN/CcmL family microcompartment protein [Deltaproteobacteria bacterium]|nr:EutN/CcmL family microcompartment protein [Deltaproteobacteria bacterium]